MGPVCVLTVPGRRTGKPRSTPVSPLTVSGRRYVVFRLGPQRPGRRTRPSLPGTPPRSRDARRGHRQRAEGAGHARLSAGGPQRSTDVRPGRHRQRPRSRRLRLGRRPGRGLRDPGPDSLTETRVEQTGTAGASVPATQRTAAPEPAHRCEAPARREQHLLSPAEVPVPGFC
ncbi:hypothetical protein [Amycolatopsis rubida]|uniref:hypothetical protein n=1 Tax=Amycolatopsis rubida TaxID=112413 RepID=UPI003CC7A4E3